MLRAILRLKKNLRAQIERSRTFQRCDQRRDPEIMIVGERGPLAIARYRPLRNILYLPGARVVFRDATAQARTVDDVGIGGIGNVVIAFVAAYRMPFALADRAVVAAAGDADGAGILLAGIDPVGKAIVGGGMIELSGRLV